MIGWLIGMSGDLRLTRMRGVNMKQRKRHRNPKSSKFDPYIADIKTYLDCGYTIRQIAMSIEPQIDYIVDENALYCFIRSKGLRSKVSQGGTNQYFKAPCYRGCCDCLVFTNLNESDARICLTAKRAVPKSCTKSPMFCHKRERQVG